MVYGSPDCAFRGSLTEQGKPLLFAMSRLDRIKNMAGLVEWYAQNEELREVANLLIVGGRLRAEESSDRDEREQIERTHALFDEYGLEGSVRWIEMQTDKTKVGELLSLRRGPARRLRAAGVVRGVRPHGRRVDEHRACRPSRRGSAVRSRSSKTACLASTSIPTRARRPRRRCSTSSGPASATPRLGTRSRRRASKRVDERYNWDLYASTLLKLSRIYGFWRYISSLERDETRRYLEMFYGLLLRPLSKKVLDQQQA